MRALITGGAGFIGSHLADALLSSGNEVIVLDNFDEFYPTWEKRSNVAPNIPSPKYKFVEGNILDFELLTNLMRSTDVVIHEAAQAGVGFSMENPSKVNSVNVTGTLNVLMAARKTEVRRILVASSSNVYGDTNRLPMNEDDRLEPISPYGASKVAAEKYCTSFSRVYGLNVIVLRYFSVYGPRMRPDLALREFAERMLGHQKNLTVRGGNQVRDWTYIDDIVAGTLAAIDASGVSGQVFNLGFGGKTTLREALTILSELVEGKHSEASLDFVGTFEGDVPATQADISKAARYINYQPKFPLREGIPHLVEWLKTRRLHPAA